MAATANKTTALQTALSSALITRYSLPASATWLTHFLTSTRQPHPPLPALTSTAHFRILASDLTTSLSSDHAATLLPRDISNVATKELRLPGPVAVQILDIQDVGSSKWSQVEAIERVERGEEVRGREVIRTVAALEESDEGDAGGGGGGRGRGRGSGANANQATSATKRSQGPHKVVLQDAAGTNVLGFELENVPRLWIGEDGLSIGCKIVLQAGTVVRRGMVMLTARDVRVLGGKIEPWDKKWKEDRKKRLIEEATGNGNGEA